MWIVAVGWAYVVILMAATETSVIAGIMTFFGYCVLPMSILFYLAGAGRRRQRRAGASASPAAIADDGMLPLTAPALFTALGAGLPDAAPSDCGNADSGAGCSGGDGGGGGGD